LLELKALYPHIAHIAYDDERGMPLPPARAAVLRRLQELGRATTARIPASSTRRAGRPGSDNAIILYTSGTTGKPKACARPTPR
jgi:long-chain acyl-CoA synthetase